MKGIRTITAIALVILTVIGWGTFIVNTGSDFVEKKSYVELADQWVEDGLYQRAILKYKEALTYDNTEDIWTKMMEAYELRYAEDVNLLSEYITELNNAVALFPRNVAFTKKLYELHMVSNDYENAYACLVYAIGNGVDDEQILKQEKELRYSYTVAYNTFSEYRSLSLETYAVKKGSNWGCIDTTGELIIDYGYPYMSSVSSDGVRIYETNLGSRLVDSDGMVLGIFDFTVEDSGIIEEDLIPVLKDGKYSYYNSFAKKQFGDYEKAGAFQEGLAAVCKNGKWNLIDSKGNSKSQTLADIKVDKNGLYMTGAVMIAAENAGKYQMFDKNGKKTCDFVADDMDICMSDGWIAYKEGSKWGYVNTDGKVTIKPQYDEARSYSNGLAAVCKDGKWGFINGNGEVVIDYQFAGADYFNSNGSCMVQTDVPNVEDEVQWQLLVLNLGIQGGVK